MFLNLSVYFFYMDVVIGIYFINIYKIWNFQIEIFKFGLKKLVSIFYFF